MFKHAILFHNDGSDGYKPVRQYAILFKKMQKAKHSFLCDANKSQKHHHRLNSRKVCKEKNTVRSRVNKAEIPMFHMACHATGTIIFTNYQQGIAIYSCVDTLLLQAVTIVQIRSFSTLGNYALRSTTIGLTES
ncbi:MAG: hypothetical protein K2Q12_07505 [Rickettsiales bacterium]|nr:hypothetical protein [Rickettsiales bacterium]